MTKMIFVNLPVADLKKSMAFYETLGFKNNPQFTDETAAGMTWSDAIHVMLLTHEKWRTFTNRQIPPTTSSEVALCISCESREAVDKMTTLAGNHGGTPDVNPPQVNECGYGRSFTDLDGHVWEPMWMDFAAMQE